MVLIVLFMNICYQCVELCTIVIDKLCTNRVHGYLQWKSNQIWFWNLNTSHFPDQSIFGLTNILSCLHSSLKLCHHTSCSSNSWQWCQRIYQWSIIACIILTRCFIHKIKTQIQLGMWKYCIDSWNQLWRQS